LLCTANGPEAVADVEAGPAPLVLPSEHLFWERTRLAQEEEGVMGKIEMKALAELRREPGRMMNNLVLDSVDLAESELAEALRKVKEQYSRIIVCETSYPVLEDQLSTFLDRVGASSLPVQVVMGCGWLYTATEEEQGDSLAAFKERIDTTFAGIPRSAFIGEILVSGDNKASTEREMAAVRTAAEAHVRLRIMNKSTGPPVFVTIKPMPTLEKALTLAEQVCYNFAEESPPSNQPRSLFLKGIVESLPRLSVIGPQGLVSALEKIASFVDSHRVKLLVSTPADRDLDLVAFAIVFLCKAGLESELLLSSGVSYKTDLVAFGGCGYAAVQVQLAPLLREQLGVQTTEKLLTQNAIKALGWYIRPASAPAKEKPRWECDFCGKSRSAKKEPFVRLTFKYCSMRCMRAHREELEANEPKDRKPPGGGSGGRSRAGNSSSWGISVGT